MLFRSAASGWFAKYLAQYGSRTPQWWKKRRLALAVQLLRGAEVLLLDEPTAGLDWSVRSDVLRLLSDLAQEQVLIVVTHEPELFNRWDSDRLRLESGQLASMTTLP